MTHTDYTQKQSDWYSKIAIAQIEVKPAQIEENLSNILQQIQVAKENKIELLVFPELCLTGYLIGDLWEEESFISDAIWAGEQIRIASAGICVVFGNVAIDRDHVGEDGRTRRYNAAFIANQGEWVHNSKIGLSYFPKTLLPNYREFEETRHFYDVRRLSIERQTQWQDLILPIEIEVAGKMRLIGVILCEDGWSDDYGVHLVQHLSELGAELILELSASPYTRGKNAKRERVFARQAKDNAVAIAYANCIGSQNNGKTIFGFDGSSTFYNKYGEVMARANAWKECLLQVGQIAAQDSVEIVHANTPWAGESQFVSADFTLLAEIIKRYLGQAGIRKVVIGVSGGIDSAVSAALFTHILGSQNVFLVSMPSEFNSQTTRSIGRSLADNLQVWYSEVSIQDSVELTQKQLNGLQFINEKKQNYEIALSPFHLENVQARDRSGRILSAIAAALGAVFPSNANKAEAMVGYSTLYGDHGGFLAPLADLWKADVYAMGRYINEVVFKRMVIPEGIFTLKPSAELSAAQNPEQGGGDPILYAYHDRLFASWQQDWKRNSPEEILESYLEGSLQQKLHLPNSINTWFSNSSEFIADLERWWKLFKGMGVVKRVQAPPVIAVSRRAFGFDYRESILAPRFSRRYNELKNKALQIS